MLSDRDSDTAPVGDALGDAVTDASSAVRVCDGESDRAALGEVEVDGDTDACSVGDSLAVCESVATALSDSDERVTRSERDSVGD